jgi:hypothetical protein
MSEQTGWAAELLLPRSRMRDEQGPLQWQGFRLAGLLCLGVAIVKLTLEKQWSWWRVLLPFWTMVGHNALYIAVGFVWLHFVDDGEATVNKEAHDGYQLAALLCLFLFVDNLVGRLEKRPTACLAVARIWPMAASVALR